MTSESLIYRKRPLYILGQLDFEYHLKIFRLQVNISQAQFIIFLTKKITIPKFIQNYNGG